MVSDTRREAMECQEQGKCAPESHTTPHPAHHAVDDLHRQMGERLSAGMMGILEFLSSLSHTAKYGDTTAIATVVSQIIAHEMTQVHTEIAELRMTLDDIRATLQKYDQVTAQRILGFQGDAPITSTLGMPSASGSIHMGTANERAPRMLVIDRVFATARRLQEAGHNITQMTTASLAREAGVKPAQFTYAFKNREGFVKQFEQWLLGQESA